jgi:nucleoside-diphosphate-sugar epimerase
MEDILVQRDERILVTGAGGFIGRCVAAELLELGFSNVVCLARPKGDAPRSAPGGPGAEWVVGNLLSPSDCLSITKGVKVILHLAAGRGEKSFPDAFANSVVTTRNLLEACRQNGGLRRFVNVSSFTLYTNCHKPRGRTLDESAPIEDHPARRGSAYCYGKVKQEQIVSQYAKSAGIPAVTTRAGWVYGPGNEKIHGRVGLGTFRLFLHLGGGNLLPLTYVENCAHAIVLAGLSKGVDGEVFNVVDDDLPTSRQFLRRYKREVRAFHSLYVPKALSYAACWAWERYSEYSQGQLPPAFTRADWHAMWKPTRYSNDKLKQRLGWKQPVSTEEGLSRHFESCRKQEAHA